MSQLTENQLTSIVEMIVDDYGSRLNGGEVSEVIGLILENISGFEWPGRLSHITPILA